MSDSGGQIKSTHTGRIRIDYARGVLLVTGQDGVDQLLAGIDPVDGRIRAKLAPDGVDVKTAELKDLVWSSDARSFRILDEGIVTLQGQNNTTTLENVSIDLGGLVPEVIGTVEVINTITEASFKSPIPYTAYVLNDVSVGLIPLFNVNIEVDALRIVFALNNDGNSDGQYIVCNVHWYMIERIAGT